MLAFGLFADNAAGQVVVRPGETVTLPTSIKNADSNGNPGGDTISSIKLVVVGDSTFVTQPTDSAAEGLAPGEAKTFTPTFVVGNVVDGTYTATLKVVSPDAGIDPDPDDPASDTLVNIIRKRPCSLDEPA